MKTNILTLIIGLLISSSSWALTPEAEAGKATIAVCNACHEETLDPAKGPPLFAINKRYSRKHPDKADFIDAVRSFVVNPQAGNSLIPHAIEVMGLMPALPLDRTTLGNIGAYLYEENFPRPCAHWAIGVKNSTAMGDLEHAAQDQRKLDRFCK